MVLSVAVALARLLLYILSCPPHPSLLPLQLAVLNLSGIVLPPSCSNIYPFASEVGIFSVHVFCLLVVAACAYLSRMAMRGKNHAFIAVGRIALTAALVTLAPAVTSATSLLNCGEIELSTSAIAVMDGGSSFDSSSSRVMSEGLHVLGTVSVLDKNTFFVCWSPTGKHIYAAAFAALTLFCSMILAPFALYVWVRNDPFLRSQTQDKSGLAAKALRCDPLKGAGSSCCYRCSSDAHGPTVLSSSSSSSGGSWIGGSPHESELLAPALQHFTPDAWYTRFLDAAMTLIVAMLQGTLRRPKSVQLVLLKAVMIAGFSMLLAVHVLLARPYKSDRRWMGWVRATLLVVAAVCSVMTAVVSAIDLNALQANGGTGTGSTLLAISLLLIVLAGTAVVLY